MCLILSSPGRKENGRYDMCTGNIHSHFTSSGQNTALFHNIKDGKAIKRTQLSLSIGPTVQ